MRTPAEAVEALRHPTYHWEANFQLFDVLKAWDIHDHPDYVAEPTAQYAWDSVAVKHTDWLPPLGYPMFFQTGSGDGAVGLSNGSPTRPKVVLWDRLGRLVEYHPADYGQYLGWSHTLCGVNLRGSRDYESTGHRVEQANPLRAVNVDNFNTYAIALGTASNSMQAAITNTQRVLADLGQFSVS